ncbi:MAG TPA: AMP-binding protein [Solirubrobacteraceae bacterium]|nr:AMP-binding protein [Solirubrobacteraceae bacterium]
MEAWLARAARLRSDRLALQAPGGGVSYAGLYQRAREVAGALVQRGVRPGDQVALALPSEQLVVAVHGCLLIGAVAVPIDLRLRQSERAPRTAGAALILEEPISEPPVPAPLAVAGDATATLMFTSGTTAGPKPVALSYDNWLWNAIGSSLALGLDPAEKWLCPMPLAHVGGLSIQIRSAIYGTTVLLHERFDTERALAALMDPDERVTLVSLVPTMLSRLLDAGLREPPTLRRALLGGGPIAPALLRRAAEAGVDVAPSYGMTEACSQIATDGFPLLGVELRIAGDGEVLVCGRTVAAGTLGPDGWLHTGDLGSFDADGRLVIAGRKADTIVTGGENVVPVEVEAVLMEHPAVADAAVFGRPDAEWGEVVVARVVPTDGAAVDVAQLRVHCASRLAPFKVPKSFALVDSVPRGATGKLLRGELG